MGFSTTYPSSLLASTLEPLIPKLHDAVTGHIPFVKMLTSKGFERTLDGRPHINHRVRLGSHVVKSYAGADIAQITTNDTVTAARFPWKQLWGYVSITGIDKAKNSGSEWQVAELYADGVEGMLADFRTEIERQIMLDGTGNASKDLDGLDLLIDSSGSYSNVGGIDSNTYIKWRNYYATASSASFAAVGENKMQTMINTVERQSDGTKVDLLLTTQAIYEAYVNAGVRIQMVRSENKGMLDLGFRNAEYMGIPMVWSDYTTAGSIYALNASTFFWNILSGFKMKMLPSVRPADQDVESQLCILYANPSCGNRARNGVIVSFTTP